jgi:hypothetical protein
MRVVTSPTPTGYVIKTGVVYGPDNVIRIQI